MPSATTAGVHTSIAAVSTSMKSIVPGRFDSSNRVMVHVLLNGATTIDTVTSAITALQGNVTDTSTTYRHGIIAAYLPTDQIGNAAAIPGVRALTMEFPPKSRVGKFTSQGAAVLGTDKVNSSGLSGDGITIGVISDSFNTSGSVPDAQEDVATGDLPVVKVLQDFAGGTDEGRAMCQIVYDEAPHSNIAFATADVSEVGFANNILKLRTQASADVIVDDVGYFDEPVFSDGIVGQAVDTAATSTTIPGHKVVYCSSAGNDGNNGYRNSYRNLTNTYVRQPGHHGNLKLISNPSSPNYLNPILTAGGWYNWSTTGGSEPTTIVSAPGPTYYEYAIFLQWDDLFDQDHGVTTNYNFLVFDAAGNYQPTLSSTANAFNTQEPFQGIGYLNLGTNYQIAITQTAQTDPMAAPAPAAHQLALYTTLDGASTLAGKYFYPAPLNVPNMFGHPQATGAIAVAAYTFSWTPSTPYEPELENFTSPGPASIYFDANDNRLATPEIRQKPEVAGVDGVLTTFFGAPYYNYPYAFFGTSAAAPSVAGVAALMIQGAGGPGSIDPTVVKSDLEASGQPRNSTVEQTQSVGSDSGGTVSVTALGQSYFGTSYFTVKYTGAAGHSISSLTINGAPAGLVFNSSEFLSGNFVGLRASNITVVSPSTSASSITLQFKPGSFVPGDSFGFTLGQDVAGTFAGYTQGEFGDGVEAEDLSYGATSTTTFASTSDAPLSSAFQEGALVGGYNQADGYGLVSAVTAVSFVSPTTAGVKQQ